MACGYTMFDSVHLTENPRIMKRYRYIICALSAALALGLACADSPFDPTTRLGEQIVEDVEPGFLDPDENFKAEQLSIAVSSAFSLLDSIGADVSDDGDLNTLSDGSFVWNIDSLYIGIWNNTKAFSYMQFSGDGFFDAIEAIEEDTGCEIRNAELHLPIEQASEAMLTNIELGLTAELKASNVPFGKDLELIRFEDSLINPQSIVTNDSAVIIQLTFDSLLAAVRQAAVEITDSITDTTSFGFFITSAGSLAAFDAFGVNGPRLMIHATNEQCDQFIAAERANVTFRSFNPDSLDNLPVSDRPTARIAVFGLHMTPLWEALTDTTGREFQNLLIAPLELPGYTADIRGSDSTFRLEYRLHSNRNFQSDPRALDSGDSLGITKAFPETPDPSDSLFIDRWLNLLLDERPDTVYLSLRLFRPETALRLSGGLSLFTRVNWDTPDSLKLKAVFSNVK